MCFKKHIEYNIAMGNLGPIRRVIGEPIMPSIALREDDEIWIVDHTPTGCRLAEFKRRDAAINFVYEIKDLADWPAITLANINEKIPDELKERIRLIEERCRKGGG